jgi:outer membrane protein TolC
MLFRRQLLSGRSRISRATPTLRTTAAVVLAAPFAIAARPAAALQPLEAFVAASRSNNLDRREALAVAEQRAEDARQAWTRLAPTVTAKASYTRNQYEAIAILPPDPGSSTPKSITITPYDQLDATFSVALPVVDVGAWLRIGSAGTTSVAAGERARAAELDAEKSVTRAFFQVVAAEATLDSARRALATAEESRALVGRRREAGSASDLDAERARAAVERARQVVASALEASAIARRSLESLSGLTPSEGSLAPPPDAGGTPSLVDVSAGVPSLPAVRAANLEARAADETAAAAWAALLPTVAGTATERLSNATGFTGHVATWAVGVGATWTLDASAYYAARSLRAGKAVADVRARRAEQLARDALHADIEEVKAEAAKWQAAEAEAEASARASKLALDRFENGAATHLDVLTAERDAFAADVARVQAQADLALARAVLRIDAGLGGRGEATR